MKKKLAATLSVVLILGLAVLGILAYLTDTDSDVNVMTLGNVSIDQLEYERVVDEKGDWVSTGETDKYGYIPDKLQEFTGNNGEEGKPLYPAVFEDGVIKWDDRNGSQNASGEGSHQQSWAQVGASGSNQLFDASVKNVQDKFVFVKNTGESNAYVRTLIAFEQGSVAADDFRNVIMTNSNNSHWDWETVATDVEVKGNKYYVLCATYKGPKSNPTGILAPGAVSYPSLLQVYMKPEATNEDVQAIDGNKNGTYDILVLSQAAQTEGFTDAVTALDTAFGVANKETVVPWFLEVLGYTCVDTPQDLKDAMLIRDANIALTGDITIEDDTPLQFSKYMFIANGREVTIDLNGHNITVDEDASLGLNALFTTANGGTLNVTGDGTIEVKNGISGIFHAMNKNDQINVYGGTYISNSDNGSDALAIIYTNSGNVDVYGGKFCSPDGVECANAEDAQGDRLSVVFHEGTLLKHDKYYAGYDATRIQLEAGCTLKAVVIDGETWYQVAK